jgi:hypothetical protein
MELLRKQTPEEKAEKELVKTNVQNKAYVTAAILALLTYFYFDSQGHGSTGVVFAFLAFIVAIPFARPFFWRHENEESKWRLSQIEARKRLIQEQIEDAAREEIAADVLKRQQAMRSAAEREQAAIDEQQRRDNRIYILTKLTEAGNHIELYDSSANFERRAQVRQIIANELSDIMRIPVHVNSFETPESIIY